MLTKITLILLGWASALSAHEMTPAYPKLKPSYVVGVFKAEMSLFNYRSDVEYYQVDVFDKDWLNVSFSTTYRVLKVKHGQRKDFDVYIRSEDINRAVYICTTSKNKRSKDVTTLVSSRICSKLGGDNK